MLSLNMRYGLARRIDKWRDENCQANCPATTLKYLSTHGLLNEPKIREFLTGFKH